MPHSKYQEFAKPRTNVPTIDRGKVQVSAKVLQKALGEMQLRGVRSIHATKVREVFLP